MSALPDFAGLLESSRVSCAVCNRTLHDPLASVHASKGDAPVCRGCARYTEAAIDEHLPAIIETARRIHAERMGVATVAPDQDARNTKGEASLGVSFGEKIA